MTTSTAFLLLLCASTYVTTTSTAFRLQLSQADANANITMVERLSRAAARTHLRFASLSGVTLRMSDVDYVVEYAIGSPPQAVEGWVDFTTSVLWTVCSSAQKFDQYNFSLSKTGYAVSCDDAMCAAGYDYETQRCTGGDHGGACAVRSIYEGLAGDLRIDEFSFGSAKVNVAFGCIRDAKVNNMNLGGPSGYIGLGRGALSLVSQVSANRFSYCLTRYLSNHSSTLFVGSSAGLSGSGPVTSAPFVMNPQEEPFSSFYYLPLSGMTVGTSRLDIPAEAFGIRRIAPRLWTGGVITDTGGSPYTALVDVAYMALKQELSRQLEGSLVPSPHDWLELCVARGDDRVPPLVLHFGGGEDLTLPAENYWAPMDLQTSCMVVVSSAMFRQLPWNETTIIGSYMLQDMQVLYDLESENIFFQPADCASI